MITCTLCHSVVYSVPPLLLARFLCDSLICLLAMEVEMYAWIVFSF